MGVLNKDLTCRSSIGLITLNCYSCFFLIKLQSNFKNNFDIRASNFNQSLLPVINKNLYSVSLNMQAALA